MRPRARWSRWTLFSVAVLILGFLVWWPLGLAALAWIIWGPDLEGTIRDELAGLVRRFRDRHEQGAQVQPHSFETEHETPDMDADGEAFSDYMERRRRERDRDRDREAFEKFMAGRGNG
jgi:hypothetical protein